MTVPGSLYTPTIRKTRASAYLLEQSLLFDGSTTYLSRTPGSSGSLTTWTFSVWVKRGKLSTGYNQVLMGANSGSGGTDRLGFLSGGGLEFGLDVSNGASSLLYLTSNAVLRDSSAWYHLVYVWDTTNATSTDRGRIYVNGTRITSLASATYPSQNQQDIKHSPRKTFQRQRLLILQMHFNTVLYTGTGSTNSVTGVGFQPDFVWWKNRTDAAQHMLGDVVRGAGKVLASNSTGAELDNAAVYFSSLDSDGFTVETANVTNGSGDAMVAWCWKAGGAAVSNTVGSITSSVSANPTSGFSIATYTGIGSSGTVGHGLGAAPKFIIIKSRSNASTNWRVYHDGLGGITKYLLLNSTAAVGTASMWGTPGTTAFTIGGATYEVNETGQTYVAYCWAEVEGFSKFGSYTGNGSTDGPFIFTGFKPAFILCQKLKLRAAIGC
jgi:hypothetical protein